MLLPTAPGRAVYMTQAATIDYSNANEGYITVTYTGSLDKRCKARVSKNEWVFQNFTVYNVENTQNMQNNGTAVLPLTHGGGDYSIRMYRQVEGNRYLQIAAVDITVQLANPLRPYLYPNTYSWYTANSKCVALSAELCAEAKSDIHKLSAIYSWVIQNIKYDHDFAKSVLNKEVSWWLPDPDTVLANRKCICFGYASLFAAMCRARGIPAQIIVGNVRTPDGMEALHAYNAVYLDTGGNITPAIRVLPGKWFRIDATFAAGMPDAQVAAWTAEDDNYRVEYRG